ncbi:MAG: hypothetical protein ACPGR8_01200 [Limisphaerales bacterium]
MYETAQGSDRAWLETAIAEFPFSSRERAEGLAYALASVVCRSSDDDGEAVLNTPSQHEASPLTEPELIWACRELVSGQANRSHLARMIFFTVCIDAAKTLNWIDIKQPVDLAARGRLARYLKRVSETCTWRLGDRYLENRLRSRLPAWSTCTTPNGVTPYRVVAELMWDEANDEVRGIMDAPIKDMLHQFSDKTHAMSALFAAVTTIQETTGGHPKLLYNADVVRLSSTTEPAIAVCSNFGVMARFGVATGRDIEYSSLWSMPALDVMLEVIVAGRDLGVSGYTDIAAAVLDNDTASPAYAYIAQDTVVG